MNIYGLLGDNLGGIAQIFFTEQKNLAQLPFTNDVLINTDLVLKSGIWFLFEPTARTTKYAEKEKLGPHGYFYEQQLQGFRAKDSQPLASAYLALRGKKLVALYQDNNGIWKLVGDNENFLKLTHDLDTGAAPTERNGTDFTFTGESNQPACYYTGALPAEIQNPAENPDTGKGFVTIENGAGQIISQVPTGGIFRITSGFKIRFSQS